MAWSLRAADVPDAGSLIGIVLEGFEGYRAFAPPGWEPPDERAHLSELERAIADPDSFTLMAEDAGFVHWFPLGEPADIHLRYLFVREPFWGTGLARELLNAAVAAMGDRTARLFTPAAQARARRFYEREGWRLVGELPDHRGFGMPIAEYRR